MRILLTNDDGFSAEGLEVLYKNLKSLPQKHQVCIMAPHGNQSGASSCIHMFCKLPLYQHGENLFSLEGTPSDCVIAACRGKLFEDAFDLVVSGINADGNLGTDTIYSGTCAGARQGALYGVPSIALSCEKAFSADGSKFFDFESAARFLCSNLDKLREIASRSNWFLNINVPSTGKIVGAKWATLSQREYNDRIIIQKNDRDQLTSECVGCGEVMSSGDHNRDDLLIKQNYVTLTLLNAFPEYETCQEFMNTSFVL